MIAGAPENKRLTPVYENKQHHPLAVQSIHHYTTMSKLGYPQGVKCWCGASLEFRYHEPAMKSKRIAFFEQHDECVPSNEKTVSTSGTQ